jgi:threonine dehydrogenase-like Zn-dependent dehydrogenase
MTTAARPRRPPRCTTMRAAVLEGPGEVAVREVELPEPSPAEVRVRLQGSGVCHSNLPLFEGREWFSYPQPAGAPGHEGWGILESVGDEVVGLAVGDRVAVLGHASYAEYDVVPAASAVRLPAALDGVDFPGEPLGCAMNIFRRSDIGPGHTVAIVGIGFLGALLTRLAANAGARVIAISRRRFALDVALRYGAHETVQLGERWAVAAAVRELTDDALCDRVIEAVGNQVALDVASDLVRERGRLVVAGFHQDGPRSVDMFQWNWRGLDVINAHERDPRVYVEGMMAAAEAVAAGLIDPAPLFTHRYPLERLDAALRDTRERPDGFLKALVIPS